MDDRLTVHELFAKGLKFYQHQKGYRFNEDALILSWYVAKKCKHLQNASALEIGGGHGVVSITLKKRGFRGTITAIEIQKDLFEVMTKNVTVNRCQGIVPLHGDFITHEFPRKFDVIFTNPPYFPTKGKIPKNSQKAIARHEIKGSLASFLPRIRAILRPGGLFIGIFPYHRLDYASTQLKRYEFRIAEIVRVFNREGYPPSTFLFTATLQKGSPFPRTKDILLRDKDGKFTETGNEIMYENAAIWDA